MKIWVGTWNMGAVDPFLDAELAKNPEQVERMLSPFIPQGYDLYVLGVQEGISDRVYEAGEGMTCVCARMLNELLLLGNEGLRLRMFEKRGNTCSGLYPQASARC